jgi:nitrate/TMAO reductase-like tetraheme cytochrome c subunit
MASHAKYLIELSKNPISLIGIGITTISAILMMVLFVMEFTDYLSNPYVGILTYLILPFFFLTGLVLIPIGTWRTRRYRHRLEALGQELPPMAYPRWDFNDPRVRKTAIFVFLATVVNVVVLSTATYEGVHYMESVTFCGTVCHTVMKPEHTSYQGSPHSRVACTACHIGPGASWFVKSKLSGLRQVVAVTFNTYERPIATPVHNLRPARETCEQCHWPERFHDANVRVIKKYSEDEKNTPLTTALLLRVGGNHDESGQGSGIHWWHMDPVNKVTYIADQKRQTMYWVEHRNAKGEAREYHLEDSPLPPEQLNKLGKRVMDCIDCHNRPTHIYYLPEESVDAAISSGQISPALPFVKKKGVELLKVNYASEGEAHAQIAGGLRDFYQQEHPQVFGERAAEIEAATAALQGIYSRNIFPEMKVTWGAYPNNLGHQNFPGCFRCHDESHKSQTGKTITQDCAACHDLLAMDEENPQLISEILQGKVDESKR